MTRSCLGCHADAAHIMKSSHWQWLGEEVVVPGHEGKTRIGKKNLLNNFCLVNRGNEKTCTKCHIGYGWADDSFDFQKAENVDCLVCHERTGTYVKGMYGIPTKETRPGGGGEVRRHAAAGELPRLPRLRRRRAGREARRHRLVAGPPLRRGGRPHGPPRLPLRGLPQGARPPDPGPGLLGRRRGLARRRLHRLPPGTQAHRRPRRHPREVGGLPDLPHPRVRREAPHQGLVGLEQGRRRDPQGGPARLPQDQGRVHLRAGRGSRVPLVQRHRRALPAGRQDRPFEGDRAEPAPRRASTTRRPRSGPSRSTAASSPTTRDSTTSSRR